MAFFRTSTAFWKGTGYENRRRRGCGALDGTTTLTGTVSRVLYRAVMVLLSILCLPVTAPAAEADAQPVDLELVLVVDASASISGNVLEFQLRGHAAAFRDERVAAAVTSGPVGAIAVTLAQFSDPNSLEVLIPWTRLGTREEVAQFADAIAAAPRNARTGSTAIGSAVRDATRLFDGNGFDAVQRTIDLTSNGFSNAGLDPALARDLAEQAGGTINAIAILNDFDWLEFYYRQSVIGGVGAFVRTATDSDSFRDALIQKLIDEMVWQPALPGQRGRAFG